ncbi:MAG TPA: monovalent cation/H(+) antiporter subunit G [Bacillota bacterium]|nr:monovalent cation/H(+) antiporter subunit G [Bacillota bacterium]
MNVSVILEYVFASVILFGAIVSVVSAIGIIRFPDVYTRAHAATKTTTVAILITLTGCFLYLSITEQFISIRLLLAIVFVFLTAPVSGHLLLRASYRAKVPMSDTTIEDELKDAFEHHEEK